MRWFVLAWVWLVTGIASAQSLDARIVWVDGKANVSLALENFQPQQNVEAPPPVEVAVSLFDNQNTRLWQTTLKIPASGETAGRLVAPLEKIVEVKKQHRLELALRDDARRLHANARLTFGIETATVPWWGVQSDGLWPQRTIFFLLPLPGYKGQTREIPASITVRDGDDAIVFQRESRIAPTETPQVQRLDVTPDTTTSVGPYSVDIDVDSESHGLSFRTAERFAQPNCELPLSSFEHADRAQWFAADGQPQRYQTGQMYYSEHLRDLQPRDYPKVTFDAAEKKSGGRALKIAYESGREAVVWSRQVLPGKAVAMSLWVKGNETDDQLVAFYEDHINFTLPAWQRNGNFENHLICSLNFAGWRRFTVPVLGGGLQATGAKGSTLEVDGPVKILALAVRSTKPKGKEKEPAEPRQVFVDDLSLQTQIAPQARLSLETRLNRDDETLAKDTTLTVAVGNGFGARLPKGKLTLTARDADGQSVWTHSVDLAVDDQAFAVADVPLAALADRQPRGPVDVDVVFADATASGARGTRRVTLKRPLHAGLVFDFEQPERYSGFQPGKVTGSHSAVVAGGADRSKQSLAIQVLPKQEDNSVLLHPAIPGKLDHIELWVQGTGRPMQLQPWFIDSGATGIWLRNYNLFWADPITVDWQGWRKVTIPAPAVPAFHGEKNRTFLFEPAYPLNLAFNVKLIDPPAPADTATSGATTNTTNPAAAPETPSPVELRIDEIRAVTHLPADAVHGVEVVYPTETRMHAPGSPLVIRARNFAPDEAKFNLEFSLTNYQGFVAKQEKQTLAVSAGVSAALTVVDALAPGVYDLEVRGVGASPLRMPIIALESKASDDFWTDPLALRRSLGLMTDRVYLDWDNVEPAPHLRHFFWFEQELKKRRELPSLPESLQPLAVKQQAAAAALAQADQAVKSGVQQINQAAQQEKQAAQKLANSEKAIDAPRAALEAAQKPLPDAQKKLDAALAEATAAAEASVAATKQQDLLLAEQKQVASQVTAAMKAVPEAEKKAKLAEDALKAADASLAEAEKKIVSQKPLVAAAQTEADRAKATADAAQAALKKLQDDKDAKEEDKKKAEAAQKDAAAKADAALAKLKKAQTDLDTATAARDAAATKRQAAQESLAKTQAEIVAAKTSLDAMQKQALQLADKVKVAQAAAMTAKKTADEKMKAVAPVKQELTKLQQAIQQAEKKLQDAQKTLDADRANAVAKEQARKDAEAAAEAAGQQLLAARAAATAANDELDAAKIPHGVKLEPVVGFSADWAGAEARDALAKGTYTRYIPNMLQAPERLLDWSLFVREIQREYKGRFDRWVFWENPDLDQAPQTLAPERYRPLLEAFAKWVKLYNPQAKVIAGGFNFDKAIDYLTRVRDPHSLPFDEIAVQLNLGELSPEQADVEGFLDDLNSLLRLRETKRTASITELDWGIGPYTSAREQAAYHSRAAMILHSRGAAPHQFSLVNTGFEFDGYGVFYRLAYGNSAELQTFKPVHVPKPAYFAMIETRKFLNDWNFVTAASLTGRSLDDQRAFLYRDANGKLAAALWRTLDGERSYRVPASWRGALVKDAFGVSATIGESLRLTALPQFVFLPSDLKLEQLLDDLRRMDATDGSHPVWLDLHLSEADSRQRAKYVATGGGAGVAAKSAEYSGVLPGGRKLRETFSLEVEREEFSFLAPKAGHALLRRRWHFDEHGAVLFVSLNGGAEQRWDLGPGQDNAAGVRESTFALLGCRAGENKVTLRCEKPGRVGGYRIEPLDADTVPLVRWGAINTRQTKGRFLLHTNAAGGPLMIGKQSFENGLGAHATSFIEYPLCKQMEKLEVTVGIDGGTEGRGSVIFRIYVDGQLRADSGIVNGFTAAKTLTVDKLQTAERVILSVTDAGDGDRHDLANWVDGKLTLKKSP